MAERSTHFGLQILRNGAASARPPKLDGMLGRCSFVDRTAGDPY